MVDSTPPPLNQRLALITGASAGIGAALARVYAAHGYDLALSARREDRLRALADEIRLSHGVEVLIVPADLADPAAPKAILDHIEAHGRVVDALVNNAGYGLVGAYADTRWEDQRAFLQVLVTAICELAHRVAPGMIERRFGRILNVASVAGLIAGSPGGGLYSAAKAFVVSFSESLHLEMAPHWRPRIGALPRLHLHRVSRRERDPRHRGPTGAAMAVAGRGRSGGGGFRGGGGEPADLRARRAQQGDRRGRPYPPRRMGHGADGQTGAAAGLGLDGHGSHQGAEAGGASRRRLDDLRAPNGAWLLLQGVEAADQGGGRDFLGNA